jgi:hypothetical protein
MPKFFERRVQATENAIFLSEVSNNFNETQPTRRFEHQQTLLTRTNLCLFCDGVHTIWQCSLPVNDRIESIKRRRLCFNCFRPHSKQNCRSSARCTFCNNNHHTLLHLERQQTNVTYSQEQPSDTAAQAHAAPSTTTNHPDPVNVQAEFSTYGTTSSNVYLPTVAFNLHSNSANYPVRALLDSGSTASFCSSAVAKYGLPKRQIQHCRFSVLRYHVSFQPLSSHYK